jgi:hypothetical protein
MVFGIDAGAGGADTHLAAGGEELGIDHKNGLLWVFVI